MTRTTPGPAATVSPPRAAVPLPPAAPAPPAAAHPAPPAAARRGSRPPPDGPARFPAVVTEARAGRSARETLRLRRAEARAGRPARETLRSAGAEAQLPAGTPAAPRRCGWSCASSCWRSASSWVCGSPALPQLPPRAGRLRPDRGAGRHGAVRRRADRRGCHLRPAENTPAADPTPDPAQERIAQVTARNGENATLNATQATDPDT